MLGLQIPRAMLPPAVTYPLSVLALLFGASYLVVSRLTSRVVFSAASPSVLAGWPLLGSLGFFRARNDFLKDGQDRSGNGHFSFYYGPHSIVAVSGEAARATVYGSRGLNLGKGFDELFAPAPSVDHLIEGDMNQHVFLTFKRLLSKERLAANLHYLVRDTNAALVAIRDSPGPIDPFDTLFRLIYQLTHRSLGSNDVADNPKLLADTFAVYAPMNHSSALEIMFPGWPTPNKLRKMIGGARLYWTFSRNIDERRASGRKGTDALQDLIDHGNSNPVACSIIIGGLFAGVFNSGTNAASLLCFLAQDRHWYNETRDQVDAVVAKHREYPDETAADVLPRLTLEEWETSFPLIVDGLKDSVRLNIPAAAMRKNISGKDITIDKTGLVVPADAFAMYRIDNVHMNPELYKDPLQWDPSRYSPERAEDKKVPHGYVGFGSGMHPCLGVRFAKLEITITTAMFLSYYDLRLCDKAGSPRTEPLSPVDRNTLGARRLLDEVYIQCTPRF